VSTRSLIILGVGIYYAIKYAFVGQAVVIGQVNYMDALNESDRFSKGYGGTIIGIAIFPVLVAFLPTYIFPLLDMFSEITLVIILAVISGFIHLYANVATSVLYMYIRKEHASIYTQEEIEECALIEQ